MLLLKYFLLAVIMYAAQAEENVSGMPIGPTGTPNGTSTTTTTSTTKPITTTSTTPKPITTTSTTPKPTTSTSTTPKPTTTTSTTPKPTTTTSTTPKPTTTTSTTPKPTTTTSTTPKPTTTTSTTPKPTSTTSPTKPTTPSPVNPIGNWSVNYPSTTKICLMLQAAIDIDIKYKDGNDTKNVTIKVPSTSKSDGECVNNTENIKLTFDELNAVSFNFKKNPENKKFDLESVIVMLNKTLPGKNDSDIVILVHNKDEFFAPVGSSYKCSKEQTLNLVSNFTSQTSGRNYTGSLRISQFQVQAFKTSENAKFDSAIDCASSETPDAVPIAVGCALAALVVVVLVGYLIGRRRAQARGYLSMFAQTKREEDYIPMKTLSCFK